MSFDSFFLSDYLVKTGSERVAAQCKENIYCITTLKDFQFVDRSVSFSLYVFSGSFLLI